MALPHGVVGLTTPARLVTMMERLGAAVASQPLPWAVATLFTASEKGGLVGMASGTEEVRIAV